MRHSAIGDDVRTYDHLDVGLEGDVFRIAFDRPEVNNAINQDVHSELCHVWRDAQDSEARVVTITGNGDAFCAGGNADGMKEAIDRGDGRENGPAMPGLYDYSVAEGLFQTERCVENMLALQKPVVAKINGDAVGFGLSVALLSDVVVAAEDAHLGDVHTSVGLSSLVGPMLWPLLTDLHTAKWYLMTGELMPASTAAEIGLVNEAVPAAELDDAVEDRVDALASGPQSAIKYTKVALNGWLQWAVNNWLREATLLQAIEQGHEDHEAAVTAFVDGRRPNFPSGRSRSDT